MAEIKSTLEIIMEKSKNLTLTEEEKEKIKKKEISDKLAGAFNKYLDGVIDLEGLVALLEEGSEKERRWAREALIENMLRHISIEDENEKLLAALDHVFPDTSRVREAFEKFRKDLLRQREAHARRFRDELASRGISGGAVIPNLKAYSPWIDALEKLEHSFKEDVGRHLYRLVETG